MFAVTPKTPYQIIDWLVATVQSVRRRLCGVMATVGATDVETGVLRGDVIRHGSSYAAFQLACKLKPRDMPDLLKIVGYGDLGRAGDERAFNACVDGYAVYDDGRKRGKL